MRWRRPCSRRAVSFDPNRGRLRRPRTAAVSAVVLSLSFHLAVGLLLLGQRKREVPRPRDVVEVRVEILESPAVEGWPDARELTAALHDRFQIAARGANYRQGPSRRQIRKDAPGAEGVADWVALAPAETEAESSSQKRGTVGFVVYQFVFIVFNR